MKGSGKEPRLPPVVSTPCATALLVENQVGMVAAAGIKRQPDPKPTSSPCARNSCQYSWHSDTIIMPKIISSDPTAIRYLV